MPRYSRPVKPETQDLLHLQVQRTERVSPHWMRVTFGGGDIDRYRYLGYDQWFRLFLPVGGEEGLERIPAKANRMLGYMKFMRIPEGVRPVMRNYTVRAYRPASGNTGAEIDVDFVLHGSAAAGTAGPASAWAETAAVGESVAMIDEGLGFNPERGIEQVLLIGDETALPAIAGIAASLPDHARGLAIVEVPSAEDALAFTHPEGLELRWIIRSGADTPGVQALDALRALASVPAGTHAFIAGEQALPTGARRHLVSAHQHPKETVSFCGYWRVTPAAKGAQESVSRSAS